MLVTRIKGKLINLRQPFEPPFLLRYVLGRSLAVMERCCILLLNRYIVYMEVVDESHDQSSEE